MNSKIFPESNMLSSFCILIVGNHEPLRSHIRETLAGKFEFHVIGDIADDYASLDEARALKPDAILLDVELCGLSGLEGARRVLQCCPNCKVLLLVESVDAEVIQEAVNLGARGYVEKEFLDADLLNALEAVCQDRQYFGTGRVATNVKPGSVLRATRLHPLKNGSSSLSPAKQSVHRHEVQFYSDDRTLVDGLIVYLTDSLRAGNRTIVIATEAHRRAINHRLWAQSLDWPTVTEEGLYISLDAASVLSELVYESELDRSRFHAFFRPFYDDQQMGTRSKKRKVVAFGEMVALLCAQGKSGTALQLERLWNEEIKIQDLHLRCAYPLTCQLQEELFGQICQEHDAIHASAS
jgi:DNA-binding NarL/FixJ family response regulator